MNKLCHHSTTSYRRIWRCQREKYNSTWPRQLLNRGLAKDPWTQAFFWGLTPAISKSKTWTFKKKRERIVFYSISHHSSVFHFLPQSRSVGGHPVRQDERPPWVRKSLWHWGAPLCFFILLFERRSEASFNLLELIHLSSCKCKTHLLQWLTFSIK